jgi:hypothetical protein
VFFPQSVEAYKKELESFLNIEKIEVPIDFQRNGRRFLYYQLFRTSLPFGDFLGPSVRTTQTRLKSFMLNELLESDAVKAILDGILNEGDFLLQE